MTNKTEEKLDQDWVDLIIEALEMGIPVSEIKAFLATGQLKD
ncbi:anti-repressor SinI family protein [Bacillus sp. B15-48]|nr:anti-repressor SinI family protein [Bacillus sp. B15-48]MBM4761007.1 DNA-binding anti-repressor SinI [Bacillus sp. B15-48]